MMINALPSRLSRRAVLQRGAAALLGSGLAVGTGAAEEAVPHVRVLFLGNSHTAHNRLPATVGELMLSSGLLAPHIGSYLQGGHNLDRHSQDADGLALLKQGADGKPWDVVVVQEHSVLSAAAAVHEEARLLMQQGLLRLVAAARAQNPRVLVVLLQLWTRSESLWQQKSADALRTGSDASEARRNIHAANAAAAQAVRQKFPDARILVSPVGDFWHLVLEAYPAMPLYYEDGTHSDTLGTMLAGLVLCGSIGGRDMIEKTTWFGSLPFSQVAKVKKVLLDHPEVFEEAGK